MRDKSLIIINLVTIAIKPPLKSGLYLPPQASISSHDGALHCIKIFGN